MRSRWHVHHVSLTALVGALLALNSCGDDPTAPPNPYSIDLSSFTQFDFWRLPGLYCLEVGDVYHLVIARHGAQYSVTSTWVSSRYCTAPDSLSTQSSLPRELTPAETSMVSSTFRSVELERAQQDSCRQWQPIRNCLARWDTRSYGRTCTVDHLSSDMVASLFALVDSLSGTSLQQMPNIMLQPTAPSEGH